MKKIFILAVSAVLLAAGCQKTEIQNEARTPIGFSSQIGKLTKAVASSTPNAENAGQFDNLYQQSFKVWGYFATEGDINYAKNELYLGGVNVFGDKTEAEGEDGKPVDMFTWHTSDTYYWPGKDKELDIYAISSWENADQGYALTLVDTESPNNNVTIDPVSRTVTVKDFVVKSGADNDLMVAPMIRQDQDDAKEVKPAFKHALTKVLVKFKRSGEYPVYVVSATTSPINSKATLSVTNTEPTSTSGPKLSKAELSWGEQSEPVQYLAQCAQTFVEIPNVVGGSKTTYSGVELPYDETTEAGTFVTFGSWLLLPQEITTDIADPLKDIYLDVEYIVAGNYIQQRFMLKAGNVTEWKKNQQTTYNVTISPDDITFEPEVDAWTSENNQTDEFEN